MIGVLAKNDNLNPSANLAAGDTTVGSRPSPDGSGACRCPLITSATFECRDRPPGRALLNARNCRLLSALVVPHYDSRFALSATPQGWRRDTLDIQKGSIPTG
jgi:hypothetical protein